jgi:parallel beta-helix repeat protein
MPSVTGALRRGAMYLAVVGTPAALPGATVTVNDTGDQLHNVGCAATGVGACTLRDAIAFSNQNPGKDTIAAAPGLGAIVPGAPLPALTDTFEIRGTPPGVGGPPFTRGFHLQGFAAGAGAHGLLVQASDSVVDGVLVELFAGSGLRVTGHRNTLGAPYGAYIVAPVVGVGNEVRSNGGPGIEISGGSDNRIYNSSISGNLGPGISLVNGAARNFIGDHYTYEVGQGFTHYYFNWITYNAGAGIQVGASAADTQTTGNVARFNVFQGNVGLPIDLAGDGSTANDPVDADTGPNGLQNAPNISVTWDGTKHRIDGTLQTTPNTAFEAHAHGGDASNVRIPVGRAVGTTDGTGNATFTIDRSSEPRPNIACVRACECAPIPLFNARP